MLTLQNLITAFLDSLTRDKQRRPGTVASYRRSLERFTTWLGRTLATGEPTTQELTVERVLKFCRWLKIWKQPNGGLLSAAAQNYHLSALRSFLGYLKTHGLPTPPPNTIPLLPLNRETIAILSGPELERLLQAPSQMNTNPLVQLRDRALLELLLSTGIKTAEAARLQRSEVHTAPEGTTITLFRNKAQTLTLSHQAASYLEQYLAERTDTYPALFVRHDRALHTPAKALTTRSIQRILESYRTHAQIPHRLTPGILRHTFAARLLTEGVTSQTVSSLLGHRHASTLKLYHYQTPPS